MAIWFLIKRIGCWLMRHKVNCMQERISYLVHGYQPAYYPIRTMFFWKGDCYYQRIMEQAENACSKVALVK